MIAAGAFAAGVALGYFARSHRLRALVNRVFRRASEGAGIQHGSRQLRRAAARQLARRVFIGQQVTP